MFRKFYVHFVVVTTVLLACTNAHAIMMREDVASSVYEANAQQSQYVANGWIGYVSSDDFLTHPNGNGVYLGGDGNGGGWLATGAHVLEGMISEPSFVEIQFGLGPDFYNDWGEYAVADAWYIHPDYDANAGNGHTPDLALVHLTTSLSATPAVLYADTVEAGDEITMIGHGAPGTNSTGWLDYDGVERAGTNIIDGYGGDGLGYLIYSSEYMFSEFDDDNIETALECMGTPGDSGGGVFIEDNGDWYLAGLMSFGTATGTPGLFDNRHTGILDLTPHHAWMSDTMTPVPEPGTFVLFATGALALLPFSRRRRRS